MGAPVLLVHDDIATIAAVRRLLSRDGHEVILVTSAADALIAFGHHLPALLVLAPGVESGRGRVVLEELLQHPEGRHARVLLLGESVPGFSAPVAPLPLDGTSFMAQVDSIIRAPADAADAWRVVENRTLAEGASASGREDTEAWHATSPAAVGGDPALANALFGDLTPLHQADWELAAMTREERTARVEEQERRSGLDVSAALEQADQEIDAAARASLDLARVRGGEDWGAAVDGARPEASSGDDGSEAPGAAADDVEAPAGGDGAGAYGLEGQDLAAESGLTPVDPSGYPADAAVQYGLSAESESSRSSEEWGAAPMSSPEEARRYDDFPGAHDDDAAIDAAYGTGDGDAQAGGTGQDWGGLPGLGSGADAGGGVEGPPGGPPTVLYGVRPPGLESALEWAASQRHAEQVEAPVGDFAAEEPLPVGKLAWTEEPVAHPGGLARPAPQLGDAGFFEVDAPVDALSAAEAELAAMREPAASAAPLSDTSPWTELPPDPELAEEGWLAATEKAEESSGGDGQGETGEEEESLPPSNWDFLEAELQAKVRDAEGDDAGVAPAVDAGLEDSTAVEAPGAVGTTDAGAGTAAPVVSSAGWFDATTESAEVAAPVSTDPSAGLSEPMTDAAGGEARSEAAPGAGWFDASADSSEANSPPTDPSAGWFDATTESAEAASQPAVDPGTNWSDVMASDAASPGTSAEPSAGWFDATTQSTEAASQPDVDPSTNWSGGTEPEAVATHASGDPSAGWFDSSVETAAPRSDSGASVELFDSTAGANEAPQRRDEDPSTGWFDASTDSGEPGAPPSVAQDEGWAASTSEDAEQRVEPGADWSDSSSGPPTQSEAVDGEASADPSEGWFDSTSDAPESTSSSVAPDAGWFDSAPATDAVASTHSDEASEPRESDASASEPAASGGMSISPEIMAEWRARQEETEQQLAEAHERVHALKAQLEEQSALRGEIEQLRELNESLRGVLDREVALRVEVETAREQEAARRLAESQSPEVSEDARQLHALQERFAVLEEEHSREATLRAEAEQRLDAARDQEERLRAEVEAGVELSRQREADLERLRSELASLQSKLSVAESRVQAETRARATADAEAKATLGRIEAQANDVTGLREQLEAGREERENLARLLAEALARAEDAEARSAREAESRAELERRLRDVSIERDDAQTRSDQEGLARSDLETRIVELEARLRSLEAERIAAETHGAAALQAVKEIEARLEQEAAGRVESETRAEAETRARQSLETRLRAAEVATIEAEVRAGAEALARAEAEARAEAASEARAAAEARVKEAARARAEAEAQAELESRARAEAEARAELESTARVEAEAKAEAESRAREEAEAKAEAESRARSEVEARARAEVQALSELESRASSEARARAEAEAQSKAEAESRAAREAKAREEAEARAAAAAKAREEAESRAEAEARARAEAESRASNEAESREEAELLAATEARAREEAESRAAEEARQRAALEAKVAAEESTWLEMEQRLRAEVKSHEEAERRAAAEAKAREEAERRAAAEEKARRDAEARVEKAARAESDADARATAEGRHRTALEVRLESEARQRATVEARLEEESAARAAAESRLHAESARFAEQLAALESRLQQMGEALAREQEAREGVAKALDALGAEKARLEAESVRERERAERERVELEERGRREAEEAAAQARAALLPLEAPPGRPELAVSRSGSVTQEGLTRLVLRLCEARMEVRLELKVMNALRVLWLRDGALVGAVSSSPGESLVDRARADGLIDARQEGELRLVRSASTGALLDALRGRGYLRESEAVPLVQRYTEQVFLDALAEPSTLYRLVKEPAPHEVALAAATRPPLHLLAEALRNTLTGDSLLEAAGSLRARVRRGDLPLSPDDFGLSQRDLQLLSQVDGEHTLEALLLGAGVPQETALKSLAVARTLGLITLAPADVEDTGDLPPELDVRRLEAKFEEIQDADYFTVLGLARTAGGEEVKRAYELLAAEFHPLRFAGHPDPALQHRAQQIRSVLSEAAQALGDDRLRAEYARSLLD
ncbi:DnaJ domain-containing protein [Myxococcus stipitatus]|uniref:DnaJ domain-containing protein n=1 Tax=Myxococcus stipitatus TaxID=83455 RepID=UPI0022791E18|nr:DnaJ domain-containing protein [Myxococcus stipitatus]